MALRRALLVTIACAAALDVRRTPGPRAIKQRKTMRVLIADVGEQAAWFPGDRKALRRPTPSQAAALRAAALESLMSEAPPLVAMLPTIAPEPAQVAPLVNKPVPEVRFKDKAGVVDEASRQEASAAFRRAFLEARQTSSGLRVAALCAVRNVRTAGERKGGVSLAIESATLEVVGRVAVRRLEVLSEEDAGGGSGLVAAVGGSAVLEDAWIDEIKQSPVHAVHRLRPLADKCCRTHEKIRAKLRGTDLIDLSVDRPLEDAAAAALAASAECDFGVGAPPLRDAYGDVVDTPAEIDELRAISFAAWRALRPPLGAARAKDVLWAFGTRSTEDRLFTASELLLRQLEELGG